MEVVPSTDVVFPCQAAMSIFKKKTKNTQFYV